MNENTIHLSVEFAYPTSTHAREAGFYDTGCWFVQADTPGSGVGTITSWRGKSCAYHTEKEAVDTMYARLRLPAYTSYHYAIRPLWLQRIDAQATR